MERLGNNRRWERRDGVGKRTMREDGGEHREISGSGKWVEDDSGRLVN